MQFRHLSRCPRKNRLLRDLTLYSGIGLLNTAVSLGVILLLQVGFDLHALIANGSGILAGLLLSFHLNRKLTFANDARRSDRPLRYILTTIAAYLVNLFVLQTLTWLNSPPTVAQFAAMIAYSAVHFALLKVYAFAGPAP